MQASTDRMLRGVVAGAALIAVWLGVDTAARGGFVRTPASAQTQPLSDPTTCRGLLSQGDRLPGVLSAVPRYGSSYVLVVPQRLAGRVPRADAPGLKEIEVGVHAGTPGIDVARALGLTRVREYPLDRSAPAQPLADVKDGKLDATILWGPLAGVGIIELGLDGQVAVFTVDKPHAAPGALHAEPVNHPCVAAIADELDANNVLPAELLVPVDIRPLLTRKPPPVDLAQARQGGPVYNEACAKCHGPDAIADPRGLAPVDLRITTPRLSYAGFVYIILNGRPERSMPPLRGTVTEEQIALIYQYLKARTEKVLPAGSQ